MSAVISDALYKSCETIFQLIDLTSLKGRESDEDLDQLLAAAIFQELSVAAICAYPSALPYLSKHLPKAAIKLTTVANFPAGNASLIDLQDELEALLENPLDELDLVFPYRALFAGNVEHVQQILDLGQQFSAQHGLIYKVILESGAFEDKEMLYHAAMMALEHGADFLKTSTGKFKIGARLEDVQILCGALLDYDDPTRGLKISGGVREIEEALLYYTCVRELMGEEFLSKNRFRFGTSALASNLLDFFKQYCDKRA